MHGTGTPLGDPIEMGAAKAILKGATSTCCFDGCNIASACATVLLTFPRATRDTPLPNVITHSAKQS